MATPTRNPGRGGAGAGRAGEGGSGAAAATGAEVAEQVGSDSQPPRALGLSFIPPQVADGAEVRVVLVARDNLSGTASGSGSVASPSGRVFIPFSVVPEAGGENLVGTLRVPQDSEAGVWRLVSVRLTDKAQNTGIYTPGDETALRGAQLVVTSKRSDSDPPVLDSLELAPLQIEDGGTVKVTVRAHDEKSGLGTVRGILANPARTVQLNFYPRPSAADKNILEGTVSLPKHSEYGDWTVTLLTLTDTANNRVTLTADSDDRLKSARVTVTSSVSDTTPPQLVSIGFNPDRVSNAAKEGAAVNVTVVASDDVSGVKGVNGWLLSPSQHARIPFSGRAGTNPGEFIGTFSIPKDAEVGTWKVERLSLSDGSGNRALLTPATDSLLARASIDVYH